MTAQTALRPLSAAQERAWTERVMPQSEKITPGTWAVPVPIPDNPLRYTYSYLLEADTGVVVVDPGWDGEPRLNALLAGLKWAGFAPSDIIGIAVTHYHRDHIGLAPALLSLQPQAWLALHTHDIESVQVFRSSTSHWTPEALVGLGTKLGVPAERLKELVEIFGPSKPHAAVEGTTGRTRKSVGSGSRNRTIYAFDWPDSLIAVDGGELLPVPGRNIRVLWTPGHTFGHIALYDEDTQTFFSGDHVLPSISPNIGLDSVAISHSLGDYLGSLDRMKSLSADVAVAPAHGYRFEGLHTRADELLHHHDQRLDELRTRAAETSDHSVYSMCRGMQWARGFEGLTGFQLYAALMETAAHMHYLGMPVPALGDTEEESKTQ